MIERFVEEYAKKLALYPDKVSVRVQKKGSGVEITLFSSQEDMGRFIGKNGKMIQAFNNVISGCRVKDGLNYKMIVQSL